MELSKEQTKTSLRFNQSVLANSSALLYRGAPTVSLEVLTNLDVAVVKS